MVEVEVLAPATCGELVQGMIDGVHFHVTCPIDLFSCARVKLLENSGLRAPRDRPKAGQAFRKALEETGNPGIGGELIIDSAIPRGKGMGSSTADIAATAAAVFLALHREPDPRRLAAIALSIEPTDGSLFPGIVLFDHREGRALEFLGPPPPLQLLILDFGGEVDTLEFDRRRRPEVLRMLQREILEALGMVKAGIASRDLKLIGEGATLSARLNQRILFKPQLEKVIGLSREVGAVGVNVAHSGTVIGVMLDPAVHDIDEVASYLRARLHGLKKIYFASAIGGGVRISGIKRRERCRPGSRER